MATLAEAANTSPFSGLAATAPQNREDFSRSIGDLLDPQGSFRSSIFGGGAPLQGSLIKNIGIAQPQTGFNLVPGDIGNEKRDFNAGSGQFQLAPGFNFFGPGSSSGLADTASPISSPFRLAQGPTGRDYSFNINTGQYRAAPSGLSLPGSKGPIGTLAERVAGLNPDIVNALTGFLPFGGGAINTLVGMLTGGIQNSAALSALNDLIERGPQFANAENLARFGVSPELAQSTQEFARESLANPEPSAEEAPFFEIDEPEPGKPPSNEPNPEESPEPGVSPEAESEASPAPGETGEGPGAGTGTGTGGVGAGASEGAADTGPGGEGPGAGGDAGGPGASGDAGSGSDGGSGSGGGDGGGSE